MRFSTEITVRYLQVVQPFLLAQLQVKTKADPKMRGPIERLTKLQRNILNSGYFNQMNQPGTNSNQLD